MDKISVNLRNTQTVLGISEVLPNFLFAQQTKGTKLADERVLSMLQMVAYL
ncbi:MAG: hypothetical protein IKJ18_09135 [Bacteroidaceae bacterium]|nr:hypothetical protein [Bacteroidaceae bacterium]